MKDKQAGGVLKNVRLS